MDTIKTYLINFWELVKRRKVISSIIAIAIILVGGYFIFRGNDSPSYTTLSQTVAGDIPDVWILDSVARNRSRLLIFT